MKIEKELLENHQVKVVAEFETEQLEGFRRQAARKISRDHKIPGFRPGKAPYDVIRRMFGDEAIENQAVELMLDDVYPKMLDEAEIKPSGPGALDKITSTNPPIFEFIVPLQPEVEVGEYKSIRIDYKYEPVTEKEIEETIKNIRNGFSTAVPVERAAQIGDLVAIKIQGTLVNPGEDEDAEIVKEMPHQVNLVETEEEENWPYKGFSAELVGMAKGDQKKVTHSYSEETRFSRFANKEIEFQITVENVKEMEYPELDDEFAKTLGEFENMDKLREVIVENLEKQKQEEYNQEYLGGIMDKLVEMSTVKYAANTLDEEVQSVLSSVEQDLGRNNLDLETYLKFQNKTKPVFLEEEIKPIAIRRLERSLILDEIAKQEAIEVKQDELHAGFSQTMNELFSTPGFKRPSSNEDMRKLANYVSFDTATRLLNQKVNNVLIQIAKGEYGMVTEEAKDEPAQPVEQTEKSEESSQVEKPAEEAPKPRRRKKTEKTEEEASE